MIIQITENTLLYCTDIFPIAYWTFTNLNLSCSCSETFLVDLREYDSHTTNHSAASAPQLYTLYPVKANIPLYPFVLHTTDALSHKIYKDTNGGLILTNSNNNAQGCCTFFWVVGSWTSLVNKFPNIKKSPNIITAGNCFGHYEQCRRSSTLITKNIQSDDRANTLSYPLTRLSFIRKSKNWENI